MTGFNLDQDVFWRSAQANQARNQQIQDLFSNLASAYTRKQELKGAKEFELEKLAKAAEYESAQKALDPERQVLGIIKKAQAGQATPEELSVLKAWDTVESRKLGVHPITGEPYRVNASIMDTLTGVAPQPAAMPVNTVDLLAGGGPKAPSAMPVPPMSAEAITVPDNGNMGQLFEGAVQPVAAPSKVPALPPAANQKQAQERYGAELDIAKEGGKKAAVLAAEKQANAPKAQAGLISSFMKAKEIDKEIEKAIKDTGFTSAGYVGQKTAEIGGTPAADLSATLERISADAIFDELQKMRDNSPTGGALGSTTERELGLLGSARAALQQKQSPSQLRENLALYQQARKRALANIKNAYKEQYGSAPILAGDKAKNAAGEVIEFDGAKWVPVK